MRWLLGFLVILLLVACEPPTSLPEEETVTPLVIVSATLSAEPTSQNQVAPTPVSKVTSTPHVSSESTTAPSLPTSLPTTSAEETTLPVILYFRTDVEEAAPEDTLMLEWASEGGTEAVLYRLLPSGQLPQSGWEVEPTGTFSYTLPSDAVNSTTFLLYVSNEAGDNTGESTHIKVRCLASWFFAPAPEVCATDPIYSVAAEQHFEHGTMIWVEAPWSMWVDEGRWIFVLYDDYRAWTAIKDTWQEGESEIDPSLTPPPDLLQPKRGFGLVWREHPDIRQRLGWATDPEMGYDTIIQQTRRYKYNATYLRALDGNVWYLGPERSSWDKITNER